MTTTVQPDLYGFDLTGPMVTTSALAINGNILNEQFLPPWHHLEKKDVTSFPMGEQHGE